MLLPPVPWQATATADQINGTFAGLASQLPALDPAKVLQSLDKSLSQLIFGTQDALGGVSFLAPADAAAAIGQQVPDAVFGELPPPPGLACALAGCRTPRHQLVCAMVAWLGGGRVGWGTTGATDRYRWWRPGAWAGVAPPRKPRQPTPQAVTIYVHRDH